MLVARGVGALLAGAICVFAVAFALTGLDLPQGHLLGVPLLPYDWLLALVCGGVLAGALAPEISRWSGALLGVVINALAGATLGAIEARAHVPTSWAAGPEFWVGSALAVVAGEAGSILAGWLRIRARQRHSSRRPPPSPPPTHC